MARPRGWSSRSTNPGGFGTVFGAPIINPPQAAIIETYAVTRKAVVTDAGAIGVRHRGHLSMTYDHRAFDGAYASAFLRHVCEVLAEHDWLDALGALIVSRTDRAAHA